MTEQENEILKEIETLKEKIISYKENYNTLQNKYEQLKTFSDNVQNELSKVNQQNGIYKSDIEKLQNQLKDIQQQNQQTKIDDQAAKDAFMQELSRVINDASTVLEN